MTHKEMRSAYKFVFDSEDGAKVLEDLEYRFHIHGSTFSDSSTETAYREGQRTVVLFLQHMLKDNPKLEEMIDE
jgi:hypothetical protein